MKALMTLGRRRQHQAGNGSAFSLPRSQLQTGSGSPVSIIHTTAYRRRERTLDAVLAIGFVAFCALLGWVGASYL
jgi:hypothetical protein